MHEASAAERRVAYIIRYHRSKMASVFYSLFCLSLAAAAAAAAATAAAAASGDRSEAYFESLRGQKVGF